MDKNRPGTVSIAMTTYNGEKYILEQLGSILAQTRKPDEVIICDDCSTDRTTAIITEFIDKNHLSNWYIIVNANNLGYIENFYNAIGRTMGDIIFLCDQDDIWHQDKVGRLSGLLEKNDGIKIINSSFRKIDETGAPVSSRLRFGRSNHNIIAKRIKSGAVKRIDFRYILWRNISPGCTLAFKKEIKELFLKQYSKLCPHDWELNLFGSLFNGLYFYNEELTDYRIHASNTIGLADIRASDRLAAYRDDKRLGSVDTEYKRACAYMESKWAKDLRAGDKRVLMRFRQLACLRQKAIDQKKIRFWLCMLLELGSYIKFRGLQGIYNDFKAANGTRNK